MIEKVRLAVDDDTKRVAQTLCDRLEAAFRQTSPEWVDQLREHLDKVAEESSRNVPAWALTSLPQKPDHHRLEQQLAELKKQNATLCASFGAALDPLRESGNKLEAHLGCIASKSEVQAIGVDTAKVASDVATLAAVQSQILERIASHEGTLTALAALLSQASTKSDVGHLSTELTSIGATLASLASSQARLVAQVVQQADSLKLQAAALSRISRPWYRRIFG